MKTINKKDLIIYGIITVITCIIFLPLLAGHYSTDSYNIYNIGFNKYAIEFSLNDGRVFMAMLGLVAGKINISIELYIFITLLIALIVSNISVILLNNIIKKYKEPQNTFQEIMVLLISYITIFNFTYLENMYFVECIVMSISTLLFLISANILVDKKSKYFIKSLILAILGIMFYQGTIGMFFTFVLLFSILKNKNNVKQVIIDLVKSGIIGVIAVLINLVSIKIVGSILNKSQTRIGSLSSIPKNIMYIITALPRVLKENFGLFPKNVLLFVLIILTTIVVINQAKNLKQKILFKYLSILFIAIASSFILNLTSLTSFYSGRTKNSLGALVGVIFIFIYVITDILENKDKLCKTTILTLIVFSVINIFNYENIFIEHKKVNGLEKIEAKELEEYILQYEKDTGILVKKITKIGKYDDRKKIYFSQIKNTSCFAHNALRCYWSADGFVNFYTKRNLKTVGVTNEAREHYEKNNDEKKGYKCIGDTLYVTVYAV